MEVDQAEKFTILVEMNYFSSDIKSPGLRISLILHLCGQWGNKIFADRQIILFMLDFSLERRIKMRNTIVK